MNGHGIATFSNGTALPCRLIHRPGDCVTSPGLRFILCLLLVHFIGGNTSPTASSIHVRMGPLVRNGQVGDRLQTKVTWLPHNVSTSSSYPFFLRLLLIASLSQFISSISAVVLVVSVLGSISVVSLQFFQQYFGRFSRV